MPKYFVYCKVNKHKKLIPIYAISKLEARSKAKKMGCKSVKIYADTQLKKLNWKKIKRLFPGLNPYGNIDKDSKINKFDCKPFNKKKQDDVEYMDEMEPIQKSSGGHAIFISPISGKKFLTALAAKTALVKEQNQKVMEDNLLGFGEGGYSKSHFPRGQEWEGYSDSSSRRIFDM